MTLKIFDNSSIKRYKAGSLWNSQKEVVLSISCCLRISSSSVMVGKLLNLIQFLWIDTATFYCSAVFYTTKYVFYDEVRKLKIVPLLLVVFQFPHEVSQCRTFQNCYSFPDFSAEIFRISNVKRLISIFTSKLSGPNCLSVFASSKFLKQVAQCQKCWKLYIFLKLFLQLLVLSNLKHCIKCCTFKTWNFNRFSHIWFFF